MTGPLTRASLLVRLRDPADAAAWREFARLYAATIYGFARRRGLQDADAADVMQEVLRSVAAGIRRLEYDPKRGKFRGWLSTVIRNKVFNFLSANRRHPPGTGDSDAHRRLDQVPGREGEEADWDVEHERNLFQWAAERVRSEFQANTWKAFWEAAVLGRETAEVGGRLGMSPGAVYVAKSRVLARLRNEIALITDE